MLRKLQPVECKRYRTFSIVIILFLVGVWLPGCGSMAIDRLLSAADKGIAAAERNDQMLIETLRKQVRADIDEINKGVDRDVDLVSSKMLKKSDGTTIALDADWVKEMRVGYFLLIESKYKQLRELEQTQAKISGNLSTIKKLLNESRKTNAGYMALFQGIDQALDQVKTEDASTGK